MNARTGTALDLDTGTGPIDLLLDGQWLSDLVGHPVLARRIRHKPGVGTVASYGPASGPVCGWVQLVTRTAQDKIVNAERRAAGRDRAVTVRPLTPGWSAVHGKVATDPRLHRALDQLPTQMVDGLPSSGGVRLLRYNPHRRLVLRWGDTVLRLTAHRQSDVADIAHALAAAGLCVSPPIRMPGVADGKRVTAWPWVDGVDLLAGPRPQGAVAAGEQLARWHAQPVNTSPVGLRSVSFQAHVQDTLDEVAGLHPRLARRARPAVAALLARLTQDCADAPAHWSHGDFSADQVIMLPGGDIRVIDLDRSMLAPAGVDLGSFCAVEQLRAHEAAPAAELSASLLQGYAAGGAVPAPESLRDWTAYGLLTRLTEPMRHAQPGWRVDMAQRWAQVQEVLAS